MSSLSKIPTNAELAHHLDALAQMMTAGKENPFKARAYRRAAETLRTIPDRVASLIGRGADLTVYPGIGESIAAALGDLVRTGTLPGLEKRREKAGSEVAALTEFPLLSPTEVRKIYARLKISRVSELRAALDSGQLAKVFGARLERSIRRALVPASEILRWDADEMIPRVVAFLRERCGATRVEAAGAYRRREETLGELTFLVATEDFPQLVTAFQEYGGSSTIEGSGSGQARFLLPNQMHVDLVHAEENNWGSALVRHTGTSGHWQQLQDAKSADGKRRKTERYFATEAEVFREWGLPYIAPESRNGWDEVARARAGTLPKLITVGDLRGELHAHTTGSDGANSILEMAAAAAARGYEYLGITDHSQSLKIAGGVSVENLWKQIRLIDKLNAKGAPLRLLKSAEVDILADGSLDYPDDLLAALDYTVCSIHSRFALDRAAQTERLLRAMDNKYFNILGHATGRLLLRRPGYEIDLPLLITRARERGCFFEINASPDRLDLSAESARDVAAAGVKIAICTDAHSVPELDYMRGGVDQARRAGLEAGNVLNTYTWPKLEKILHR